MAGVALAFVGIIFGVLAGPLAFAGVALLFLSRFSEPSDCCVVSGI